MHGRTKYRASNYSFFSSDSRFLSDRSARLSRRLFADDSPPLGISTFLESFENAVQAKGCEGGSLVSVRGEARHELARCAAVDTRVTLLHISFLDSETRFEYRSGRTSAGSMVSNCRSENFQLLESETRKVTVSSLVVLRYFTSNAASSLSRSFSSTIV